MGRPDQGITLRVSRLDGNPGIEIRTAEWLAEYFFFTNASSVRLGTYTPWDAYTAAPTLAEVNRIVLSDITAINQSMAARTGHKHWQALRDAGDLPWLAALDPAWDLIQMTDGEWIQNRVEERIGEAVDRVVGPWRGLSVTTKVLATKRPRLVPILDELVIRQVGGRNDPTWARRLVSHVRQIGLENLSELQAIDRHLRGCEPPIERPLARILDALLWSSTPGLIPYSQFTRLLTKAAT